MTVIAYDGKTLAADKRSTSSGLISVVTKIYRIPQGIVGFSGVYAAAQAMLHWFRYDDAMPDLYPAICADKDDGVWALHIDLAGKIWMFDKGAFPFHLEQKFHAIGSGRDFAIAAMECGKTAKEAVEIASMYQSDCGSGVDTMEIL